MSSSGRFASWLTQSIEDLEAARANFDQGRHALACFLCHESAVKIIKSFLYKQGAEMVWGQHLSDLCEDAMAFDPSFDFVKSVASLLDKHALATRNPDTVAGAIPFEIYDSSDSEHALEIATEVLETVQSKISEG